MIRRLLIANRGEIACRIIETARRMGIGTVAVSSDADMRARHVVMADTAVHIGPSPPSDSYLNGDAIIEAAVRTGCEAIHPGYGFLSENPEFAEAVEAAGLIFVGPSAAAIRAMGLKDTAKALMERACVPVISGHHGENQDDRHLFRIAGDLGYPVLIKAVAGGGGKGMRRVDHPDDFADALASARAEAKGAFGNDAVLIEKFLKRARHIEVQIFGDGEQAVHLYERDCSIQRRHQKVIEEAPAPGMTVEMRTAICAAAVRAAEAIGYKGAGTVEFIADSYPDLHPDRFYFMEMNTRLQVEHPVTEAITGIDLVEWQILVAGGSPLPRSQKDIRCRGHAVEARLYAEDVPKGFLPATGTLEHLVFPPDVRVDSGVRAGDTISHHYDPMIAKLVTYGDSRAEALLRMDRAITMTEVAGLVTNQGFLLDVVRRLGYGAGEVDTGFIDHEAGVLGKLREPDSCDRALAAVVALGLDRLDDPLAGFSLWAPFGYVVKLMWNGEECVARVTPQTAERFTVTIGRTTNVIAWRDGAWWINDVKSHARCVRRSGGVSVFLNGGYHFELPDPLSVACDAAVPGDVIEAPMPGHVKAVFARAGDHVAKGDRLALLEAMKMEHTLVAARDGMVAEVLAVPGTQVGAGAALILMKEVGK